MTSIQIPGDRKAQVEAALDRAVDFLQARQLPHGEFATLLGRDRAMSLAVPDSTVFTTAQLIHSLAFVESARTREMIRRAADFLRAERECGGLWRYWSSRNHRHARLGPDLDDTACASFALRRAGLAAPDNLWAFRRARDAHGRFFTWMRPGHLGRFDVFGRAALAVGAAQARRRAARTEVPVSEDPRFVTMHIDPDDVDPVVNANVLLWLGERTETEAARRFVAETVLADPPTFSRYYEDPLVLHYAVARASEEASPGLRALGPHIVGRIEARLDEDKALDPLKTALAAASLAVFAPRSAALDRLVDSILAAQRPDGGWQACAYYNVWGSEELTTGFCLETLARYSLANRDVQSRRAKDEQVAQLHHVIGAARGLDAGKPLQQTLDGESCFHPG